MKNINILEYASCRLLFVVDLSATERRHAEIPDSAAASCHPVKQAVHLSTTIINFPLLLLTLRT